MICRVGILGTFLNYSPFLIEFYTARCPRIIDCILLFLSFPFSGSAVAQEAPL
jgi:hypothetical protein